MNKLMIGALVVMGVLYYFGSKPTTMTLSSTGVSGGGSGISSYANSSGSAVKGIGGAASGVLK